MVEVPKSFEVQCGSILIIDEHPSAIVLALGDNCVDTSDIDIVEGVELIHWLSGTVIASYIDRVEERWSKDRMEQAIIAGVEFYAKLARRSREFTEETRSEWIDRALGRLNENYPKDAITLT